MRKIESKTYFRGRYRVDIVRNEEDSTIDFWLYHERYGTKTMMFGLMEKDIDFSNDRELAEMVEANIDDFIPIYMEDIEAIEQRP